MNEEELKRLIEKYYKGESTEGEENSLREYFKKADIPRGYEAEKVIFGFYNESAEIPEPSIDFEARILAGIDASERNKGLTGIRKYLIPLLSAAAALLILGGSYFFFIHRTETADTFKDPRIAYAETIKILRDVSLQLNRGGQALEPVSKINQMRIKSFKTINKSTEIVETNIKKLDRLQRAIELARNPVEKSANK